MAVHPLKTGKHDVYRFSRPTESRLHSPQEKRLPYEEVTLHYASSFLLREQVLHLAHGINTHLRQFCRLPE